MNSCFKFDIVKHKILDYKSIEESMNTVSAEAKLVSVTEGRIFIKEWVCWTDVLIPPQADTHSRCPQIVFPSLPFTLNTSSFCIHLCVYVLYIVDRKIEIWSSDSLRLYVFLAEIACQSCPQSTSKSFHIFTHTLWTNFTAGSQKHCGRHVNNQTCGWHWEVTLLFRSLVNEDVKW